MINITHRRPLPTKEVLALQKALELEGVKVYREFNDGFKHIDLTIPRGKMNVEVDGIQHLTNPHQIVADLSRGYYSHKNGYDTMHIPNEMIRLHLPQISKALAEASKIRSKKVWIHVG